METAEAEVDGPMTCATVDYSEYLDSNGVALVGEVQLSATRAQLASLHQHIRDLTNEYTQSLINTPHDTIRHDQLLMAIASTEEQVYSIELQLMKMICAVDDSVSLKESVASATEEDIDHPNMNCAGVPWESYMDDDNQLTVSSEDLQRGYSYLAYLAKRGSELDAELQSGDYTDAMKLKIRESLNAEMALTSKSATAMECALQYVKMQNTFNRKYAAAQPSPAAPTDSSATPVAEPAAPRVPMPTGQQNMYKNVFGTNIYGNINFAKRR